MILIGYRHALRASELCDLQWSQVDGRTFTHVVYSRQRKRGRRKTRLNVRYPTHCYPKRR
jgi:integrase